MTAVDQRVTGDWSGFEAAGTDPERRAEFLELQREEISMEISVLREAAERGCVEYKLGKASEAKRQLEQSRFKSLTAREMMSASRVFASLAYVSLLQRLMCSGSLRIRDTKAGDEGTEHRPKTPNVKGILADIQERIKSNPEVRDVQEVRNILLQLSRYQRELNNLKEAAANAPKERRQAMAESFKGTADGIFASITKNYQALENAEAKAATAGPRNILLRVPIKELVPLYQRQCKSALALRSKLLWAKEENYQTRETLVEAADETEALLELYEEEFEQFRTLAESDKGAYQLAQAFNAEIQRRIELETAVY